MVCLARVHRQLLVESTGIVCSCAFALDWGLCMQGAPGGSYVPDQLPDHSTHGMCSTNPLQAVRLLMQNGASPSTLNRHERTPVDEALDRGHQTVVDLINSFSAPSQEAAEVEGVDEEEQEGEEAGGEGEEGVGVEAMLEDKEGEALPAAAQQLQPQQL